MLGSSYKKKTGCHEVKIHFMGDGNQRVSLLCDTMESDYRKQADIKSI